MNLITRMRTGLNIHFKQYSTKELFVAKIPYDATKDEIDGIFRLDLDQSNIKRIKLPLDRKNNRTYGYVFLDTRSDQIQNVIDRYDGLEYKGKKLSVCLSVPKEDKS